MDISTALGSFIGLVIVIVISVLVISLLIWLVVLVWKKGIFPILNKREASGLEDPPWRYQ